MKQHTTERASSQRSNTKQQPSTKKQGTRRALLRCAPVLLAILWAAFVTQSAGAAELTNGRLSLELGVTPDGMPVIQQAIWTATGLPAFTEVSSSGDLTAWLPQGLLPSDLSGIGPAAWTLSESDQFFVAEASRALPGKLQVTWVVELAKKCSVFRVHVRLTNASKKRRAVEWFPAWMGSWQVADSPQW